MSDRPVLCVHPETIDTCSSCGVTTVPKDWPLEFRPEGAKVRHSRDLCVSCSSARRREDSRVGAKLFRRAAPCRRCGIERSSERFVREPLCMDCRDLARDLDELERWSPSQTVLVAS